MKDDRIILPKSLLAFVSLLSYLCLIGSLLLLKKYKEVAIELALIVEHLNPSMSTVACFLFCYYLFSL